MFPQTSLIEGLSRKFFSDEVASKIASWESVFGKLPLAASSDDIAESFEFYVQQEIAGQVARGEEPNRELAEATIPRHHMWTRRVRAMPGANPARSVESMSWVSSAFGRCKTIAGGIDGYEELTIAD